MFTVLSSRNCWGAPLHFLAGACTLTLLILIPERKYSRWPNTGAYGWRSQWEGSVSNPLYKPLKKVHTQINQCWHAKVFDSTEGPLGRFPFHQLSSSSSYQNQLKDWDLICCHSSSAWFGWQAGSWAVEWMQTKQGGNFRALEDSPLSREAIIKN